MQGLEGRESVVLISGCKSGEKLLCATHACMLELVKQKLDDPRAEAHFIKILFYISL